MKYTIDKQDNYSTIRLHEEKMDSDIAPNLKSELITLHAEGVRNIILDLTEVKYTDSSGLSAMLVGNRILQEDGGMFILAGLSDHTSKLIKISQLDSVLTIMANVDEAINAVVVQELEKGLREGDE